jgi:hypothetical protein
MAQNGTEEKLEEGSSADPALDEQWFASGERLSTPPPASTRSQRISSLPPAEPIGDVVADDWFR